MTYNEYDKDNLPVEIGDGFKEMRKKVVLGFTNSDLKGLKDGGMLMTPWIVDQNFGGEFRIIVQGRRVGENQNFLYDGMGRPIPIANVY